MIMTGEYLCNNMLAFQMDENELVLALEYAEEELQRLGKLFDECVPNEYIRHDLGAGFTDLQKAKEYYGEQIHDLYSAIGAYEQELKKRKSI